MKIEYDENGNMICPYCGGEVVSKGCCGTVIIHGIETEAEADWEECEECGRIINDY